MKLILFYIGLTILNIHFPTFTKNGMDRTIPIINRKDSLPRVFTDNHSDLVGNRLNNEAFLRFTLNQLPNTVHEWKDYRIRLRNEIIKKAGILIDHKLPLNYQETGTLKMKGYSIKKIIFQTRPGIYATANLYVPDGKGPFPAVINMNGHWEGARMSDPVQAVGHSLALNGYVCLNIDAFGSGERSTYDGIDEYHGGNLGASLMDIGESLMGFQVSDNIRGVDLLCSLPYVDAEKIGATGGSGGGNQTLWVTAIDDRIKAAVPVVSVGTFESYVMNDNCVCELLIDGLTFTEESGILALIAPRAIRMCNHKQDDTPSFYPSEMYRSFDNAKPIFKMLGVENNIDYKLFNLTHGYWDEDRQVMIGWFNLYLKAIGNGGPVKEIPFKTLSDQKLRVYAKGQRDPKIVTIAEYCKRKGTELRNNLLSAQSFNVNMKKKELRNILRISEKPSIKKVYHYSNTGIWERFALQTSDNKLIPVLHLAPNNKSLGYVIICDSKGKNFIPDGLIDDLKKKGIGIVITDLSGTGEVSSIKADSLDGSMSFHTISRADLWLGKTVLGEWINELEVITQFLKSRYHVQKLGIDGSKEAGLAGLFLSIIDGNINNVTMRQAPISYDFDNRDSLNFFSMAIHLPGFLNWGDVSLATALSGKNVTFINPVTMSGRRISSSELKKYRQEFEKLRRICNQPGQAIFSN